MQQRGFTLIELVIVIVILGILAVTAAPRFVDFQTDARIATLEGVEGGSYSCKSNYCWRDCIVKYDHQRKWH